MSQVTTRCGAFGAFGGLLMLIAFASAHAAEVHDSGLVPYTVKGDAITTSLTGRPGDPAAGREVVIDRKLGNCLSCHALPLAEADQGNIGPDLHGVGARLSAAQLRLRVVNTKIIDPQTIMPAYYRADGLYGLTKALAGKPILTAQQVEDLVSYLATLKTKGAAR